MVIVMNNACLQPRGSDKLRGFLGQVMLSMDRGWYSPGQPGGGTPKPFTYLSETFLPELRAAGLSEDVLRQLTVLNPFRAFAR